MASWKDAILRQLTHELDTSINESSKGVLLRHRLVRRRGSPFRKPTSPAMRFRSYLRIPDARHRIALTRLLLSDHDLALELLRWEKIPEDQRLCRRCRTRVESPEHILFECDSSPAILLRRRSKLTDLVWSRYGRTCGNWTARQILWCVLRHNKWMPLLGSLAYCATKIWAKYPLLRSGEPAATPTPSDAEDS